MLCSDWCPDGNRAVWVESRFRQGRGAFWETLRSWNSLAARWVVSGRIRLEVNQTGHWTDVSEDFVDARASTVVGRFLQRSKALVPGSQGSGPQCSKAQCSKAQCSKAQCSNVSFGRRTQTKPEDGSRLWATQTLGHSIRFSGGHRGSEMWRHEHENTRASFLFRCGTEPSLGCQAVVLSLLYSVRIPTR